MKLSLTVVTNMGKKKTTEEFICQARAVHGNKYDYSKVEYTGTDNKVVIICAVHGEFEQTPYLHLKSQGCSKCGKTNGANKRRKTTEQFINEAKAIHGDIYDYSLVEYKTTHTKVTIICKIHGNFTQEPNSHVNDEQGCPKCGKISMANKQRKTKEEFIKEATDKFGDLYDYSLVDYKSSSTKVLIICKTHNEFSQSPQDHLSSLIGCPKCAKLSMSNTQMLQKLIKNKGALSYYFPEIAKQWHPTKNGNLMPDKITHGSNIKVWWLCPNVCEYGCLHEYEAIVNNRTNKSSGCPYCCANPTQICVHKSIVTTHPDIAKQWHPTKNGDLKLENVSKSSDKKVWWLCPNLCEYGCLHEYEQKVDSKVRQNHGCPYCSKYSSTFCIHQSFGFTYPEKAKEWHPIKNGNIKPENVSCNSHSQIYWLCSKNHLYLQTPNSKTSNNSGCPKCCLTYSRISLQWLSYLQISNIHIIQHAESDDGEYKVHNTIYKADGYCKETNTVYEFHGDFWHGNPKRFNSDDINNVTKTTFGKLYQKTQDKKYKIQELGYNYIEMWEYDWKRAIKAVKKVQRMWRNKHGKTFK